MSKEFELGKIIVKKEGDHPTIKLWGIITPENLINQLSEVEADPREKDAVLKGWVDISEFTEVGGIVTSNGILLRQGNRDTFVSTTRITKAFEIGIDFASSLGYIPTTGGSVNLHSNVYQDLLSIRKGFGKFMHTTYRSAGILEMYTVDPDAVAQQVLLNLAVTRGQGRIEAA